MQKVSAIIICLLLSLATFAKTPKWYKNVKNGVCSIITYDEKGNELSRGNGFFIDSDGTGITDYILLKGASRAVTIDAAGNEREIIKILGANGLYEVIKFHVTPDKKLKPITLSSAEAFPGNDVFIIPYSTEKKSVPLSSKVNKSMKIEDDRYYYTLPSVKDSNIVSLPVVDEDGSLIGLVQKGNDDKDTCLYVLDARFAADLQIEALSLNQTIYKNIKIKKALPAVESQALSYIYMTKQTSDDSYYQLLNDFIDQFPQSADGYYNRGSYSILFRDSTAYQSALDDINKSIELADDKDKFHHSYANLIYSTIAQQVHIGLDFWTLDKALEEINIALSINPLPIYTQLQGRILFAQKKYPEALISYTKLNNSELASADTYMFSYAIKREMGADLSECIELLDSAINFNGKPISQKIAPYILERASAKEEAGKYRESVADCNEYEKIAGSYNLTSEFYYFREQIEIKAKMYEPALSDIEKARSLAPADSSLTLEHASLYLRLGMDEKALPLLTELVDTYPNSSDSHRLLGICYMRAEDKDSACKELNKAKQLGDTIAEELILRNCQ